jgi:hypothetical protein
VAAEMRAGAAVAHCVLSARMRSMEWKRQKHLAVRRLFV